MFQEMQLLTKLRQNEPALRYGRQYFRPVSGNGTDFGYSYGTGGIVAYSRILGDREILIAANTGQTQFDGRILVDHDLNGDGANMRLAYPAAAETLPVEIIDARIDGSPARLATVKVTLAPHEVRIWTTPTRSMAVNPVTKKIAA